MYIDKLDDKINKYNNTYHKTIGMKRVDVKRRTYIDSSKEILRRVLWVMKYFSHILIDHEIFFKILMGHKIFSYVLFS